MTILSKVYTTKYALAEGILEYNDVEVCDTIDANMICVRQQHGSSYFHKNEWFIDKKDALKKAEELRTKKINSLKKSLAKLEKKVFI